MPESAGYLAAGIAVVALLLAPVASRLIKNRGDAISGELDGGRTGASLSRHLDKQYESRNEGTGMREAEIRQLLEAKAYGQRRRGEPELDVEVELERLIAENAPVAETDVEAGAEDEIREVVIANNARRERAGKPPLNVDKEVERRMRDLN